MTHYSSGFHSWLSIPGHGWFSMILLHSPYIQIEIRCLFNDDDES